MSARPAGPVVRPAALAASALVAFVAVSAVALGGVKSTGTWTAPDVSPRAFRKIAVLAKISDELTRRVLEDAVVAGLKEQGIDAVAAYDAFTAAELSDEAALRAKVEQLGVDGGIVFTVEALGQQVKSGPNVHASVGVPVRAGPFSVFLGTSVPLGGGTSVVKQYGVKAEFLDEAAEGPRWIGNFTTDLKGGAPQAAGQLAALTLKQLKKSGLFPKK